jgi:acetolactate synthase-1/2/3 large subunit
VREILDQPGPALVDVILDPEQEFEPRSRAKQLPDGRIVSPPLEDMYPFLGAEELAANTIDDGPGETHSQDDRESSSGKLLVDLK